MTEEGEGTKRDWKEETEEALERVGDSLRAAWQASRETRMGALEAARHAARQLGEAIDRGVGAAKERWSGDSPSQDAASAGEEE